MKERARCNLCPNLSRLGLYSAYIYKGQCKGQPLWISKSTVLYAVNGNCSHRLLVNHEFAIVIGMSSFESSSRTPRNEVELGEAITDPEEAQMRIHELFERGERPVVSVPAQYVDVLKKGLVAHATWLIGVSAIVGTLGRPPYIPVGEKRVLVRVEIEDERQLEPRFTGPSHTYQGVVVLRGPIPPEKITIIE